MNGAVGLKFILKSVFEWLLRICKQCRRAHIFSAEHINADV